MEKNIPKEEENKLTPMNIFQKFQWKQKQNGNFTLHPLKDESDILLKRKASLNQKSSDSEQKKNLIKIIDNTEKYKVDMIVMTEWGVGKILSINEGGIAMVKIEGSEVEFPLMSLNTSLTVYCCILCKDTSYWAEIKVGFDYSVNNLKEKIALIIKCHPSQIVIIHGGRKIDKNVNIFELGIYEKDVFLAVIKDPEEMPVFRSKTHKTTNKQSTFNALSFRVSQDIVLTALGLYKNSSTDVLYHILIFEEDSNMNLKLIFSEKKILVKPDGVKDNPIFKHAISSLDIKANVSYQIHQYLNYNEGSQYIGFKCLEECVEKNTQISFKFANCKIPSRENSTDIEEGMIPLLYFCVKTEKY